MGRVSLGPRGVGSRFACRASYVFFTARVHPSVSYASRIDRLFKQGSTFRPSARSPSTSLADPELAAGRRHQFAFLHVPFVTAEP